MFSRLATALLMTCLLGSTGLMAQRMEIVEPRHIYSNANLVLVFQMRNLEAHLTEENREALKKTHAWLYETIGLETARCKEVILQFGADDYLKEFWTVNDFAGFVFRAEDEISGNQISEFAHRFGFEEMTHRERSYIGYFGRGQGFLFHFHENSLIIAEEEPIKSLIDSEVDAADDRDIDLLQNLFVDAEICACVDFDNESFRELFPMLFRHDVGIEVSDALSNVVNNAKNAAMTADLDFKQPITVVLEVSETGDIEVLREATGEFVTGMQRFAERLKTDLQEWVPADIVDSAKRFTEALADLFANPDIFADETSVTITISDTDAASRALNEFVAMMNAVADS